MTIATWKIVKDVICIGEFCRPNLWKNLVDVHTSKLTPCMYKGRKLNWAKWTCHASASFLTLHRDFVARAFGRFRLLSSNFVLSCTKFLLWISTLLQKWRLTLWTWKQVRLPSVQMILQPLLPYRWSPLLPLCPLRARSRFLGKANRSKVNWCTTAFCLPSFDSAMCGRCDCCACSFERFQVSFVFSFSFLF